LRSARESLAAKQLDKAVSILEEYQLEHGSQPDIDELLRAAQQELNALQLRGFVERTLAEVRTLRDDRPLDAIRLLESAVKDKRVVASGDRTLARLLEEISEQQAAAARKLEAVEKRAQALGQRGELGEAIKLLTEFLAANGQSSTLENLLHTLEAEQERKQVTARAIQSARESTGKAEFAAAFESLKAIARAYGESDELTQADKAIRTARSGHAQQVVGRSIEISRAALLNNNVPAALDALREAGPMVEFADSGRQADWRRIGQAAKKAQSEPPSAGAVIADPLADLPAASRKRPLSIPLLAGIGAVCVLVVVVAVFVMHKPSPPTPVVTSMDAHISIANVPPGAVVSIDNGTPVTIDASGTLTLTVQPGQHLLEVTMSGYDPFTERFQVIAGQTYVAPVQLTRPLVGKNIGTLVMRGNIAGFKIVIDGRPYGEIMKKEGSRSLEAGEHKVRYTNEDGTDSQEHTVQIAAGKDFVDRFTLKAPAPIPVAMGSLQIATTPNARIVVDGQPHGTADSSGKLTIAQLPVGNHNVEIALDNRNITRTVAVSAGQSALLSDRLPDLPPPAPTTGSITVSTNAQAQIFLDSERKGFADSSGQFNLDNIPPGNHKVEVTLEHFVTSTTPVSVRAGEHQVVSSHLQAEMQPLPLPKHDTDPPKPVEVDYTADYAGIDAALKNFEQAYKSRKIDRVQATWLDIGAYSKQLGEIFKNKEFDNVHIEETCSGHPAITGNTATQNCSEIVQSSKDDRDPVRHQTKITFVKSNGTWVMKDKK